MPKWINRLLRLDSNDPTGEAPRGEDDERARRADWARIWLEARESGRLNPPNDPNDVDGWNQYWTNQIEVGPMEQGFSDMMSSDPRLPLHLANRQARTVLCTGNGLSTEALALAIRGFDVTALDISEVATRMQIASIQQRADRDPLPGRWQIDSTGGATFATDLPIAPELRPAMHRGEDDLARGGGRLVFVTGNLMDAELLPGPFDVVIERRTLQLFAPAQQERALERLAARLAPTGMLISQEHSGGWRPHQPRLHFAKKWVEAHHFAFIDSEVPDRRAGSRRRAQLIFSTG